MPIFEYVVKDGPREGERIEELFFPADMHGGRPPDFILVDSSYAYLVPSAAAFTVKDGTELFYKAMGRRVIEPGHDRDVARNAKYKQEKEDRERREALGKIVPEAIAEATAEASR